MALKICFFEDENYRNFFPLTYLRPVFSLRSGMVPLFQRVKRIFPEAEIILNCRSQVAPVFAAYEKEYPINIIKKGEGDIIFLNGRIRGYGDLPKLINESKISTVLKNSNKLVGVILKKDDLAQMPALATQEDYLNYIDTHAEDIPEFHTTATLYNYLWELMADIETEIKADFELIPKTPVGNYDGVYFKEKEKVVIGDNVKIQPSVVIDAANGPIYIGSNTTIEANAALYGPLYLGPNCVITPGKISSSSIGHTSRVGGEIEWTICQSYVNKYHTGFLGHSYIGSWVNIGAQTTNSDLKNNYGEIKVKLNGKAVQTGSNKIGSFVGDHTKFGIGMFLNTGIMIAPACNLFGASLLLDREIPAFSWGNTGNYKTNQVDKVIETARVVASRRNVEFSEAEAEMLKHISENDILDQGIFKLSRY